MCVLGTKGNSTSPPQQCHVATHPPIHCGSRLAPWLGYNKPPLNLFLMSLWACCPQRAFQLHPCKGRLANMNTSLRDSSMALWLIGMSGQEAAAKGEGRLGRQPPACDSCSTGEQGCVVGRSKRPLQTGGATSLRRRGGGNIDYLCRLPASVSHSAVFPGGGHKLGLPA